MDDRIKRINEGMARSYRRKKRREDIMESYGRGGYMTWRWLLLLMVGLIVISLILAGFRFLRPVERWIHLAIQREWRRSGVWKKALRQIQFMRKLEG